jgi:hypothetical protein
MQSKIKVDIRLKDHTKIKVDDVDKTTIINIFNSNIKGKEIPIKQNNHDGYVGHWLEQQFGIAKNNNNAPDILGYELKKYSSKITLGDWSASYYLWQDMYKFGLYKSLKDARIAFIKMYGSYKSLNNRYSWAGSVFPKYNIWNEHGQILTIKNNDICILYNSEYDHSDSNRPNGLLLLAKWAYQDIKEHVEKKFNQKGFILCKQHCKESFEHIRFGQSITVDIF